MILLPSTVTWSISLISFKLFIICFTISDGINLLKTDYTLRCFMAKSSIKTFSQHVNGTESSQVPARCRCCNKCSLLHSLKTIRVGWVDTKSLCFINHWNISGPFAWARDILRVFSINNNETYMTTSYSNLNHHMSSSSLSLEEY